MGDMHPPVLLHYELDNFYQNHRRYVNGRDHVQLFRKLASKHDALHQDQCSPLFKIGDTYINPCGLIANTLFNDVITLESTVGSDGTVIENAPMFGAGIAGASDLKWKL